jgi:hypothetical protein
MQKTEKKFWNRLYIIVVVFLLLQVVFYYFITKHFQTPII